VQAKRELTLIASYAVEGIVEVAFDPQTSVAPDRRGQATCRQAHEDLQAAGVRRRRKSVRNFAAENPGAVSVSSYPRKHQGFRDFPANCSPLERPVLLLPS